MYLSTCPSPSAPLIMLDVVASVTSTHHHQTMHVLMSLLVICVFAAVAPTVFINGTLDSAQVTAAAGDDVAFTCLARGFPETTISIQLSGVNASYTIENQTLMTEATPTNFMEVTRTVTLYSVTVLDCGAVVTCEGSNMNSDGFTHTDQAAATLLVQGEVDSMLMSIPCS